MLVNRLMSRKRGAFDGKIMAVGAAGRAIFSEDGRVWTDKSENVHDSSAKAEFDYTSAFGDLFHIRGDSDGSGTYVVPDVDRRLFISSDNGTSWVVSLAPSYYTPLFVKYLGGYWWLGNVNGELWRSTDAKIWVQAGSLASAVEVYLADMMTNGTDFIAVGVSNSALTVLKASSATGTFTQYFGSGIISSNETVNACAYGNSVYVAIGDGGLIATSSDGQSWTEQTVATIGTVDIQDIKYANSRFMIAVQDGSIYTSTDGVTWTAATTPTGVSELASLEYYNGTWCVAGDNTSNVNVAWESSDNGATWTQRTLSSPYNESTEAEYGDMFVDTQDGEFVIIGPVDLRIPEIADTTLQKGSGTTWAGVDIDNVTTKELLTAVATDESRWVVVGLNGFGAYSDDDGDTWTKIGGFSVNFNLYDVAYDATLGQWIAVGENGRIYSSSNGASWTTHALGGTDDFYAVTSNGSIWVAVGEDGLLYSSTNGTTWTARGFGSSSVNDFVSVTYGNSTFVATGFAGEAQTSSDGITWTQRSITTASTLFSCVLWNETASKFYCFEDQTEDVWTSADGITWTEEIINIGFSPATSQLLNTCVGYFEHSDGSQKLWVAAPYDTTPTVDSHIYTAKSPDNWNEVSLTNYAWGNMYNRPGLIFRSVAGFANV